MLIEDTVNEQTNIANRTQIIKNLQSMVKELNSGLPRAKYSDIGRVGPIQI